ncbi:hypothetical protein GY45DRAFT_1318001 [Cubamyces sp. BRFM 1775]|nr:hypothetical protein GY45DRAFT_1318001 [Cubamyces sp. BRFM 1775]
MASGVGAASATRLARACFMVLGLLALIHRSDGAILSREAVAGSCLDSSYSWAYNSQGLTPCQVEGELMQTCNNSAGIVYPCICNSVGYSLWAVCSLCIKQPPHSFSIYLSDAHCSQQYDAPSSDGVDVPGWASLPLIDGETFNVQAAEQEAEGIQPSGSSSDGHAATPSVQSSSSQAQGSSAPAMRTGGTPTQASGLNSSPQSSDSSIPQGTSDSLPNNGAQTVGTSQPTAPVGQSSGSRTPGALTDNGASPSESTNSRSSYSQTDFPTSSPNTPLSSGSTQPTNVRSSSLGPVIGGVVGSAITIVIIAIAGCLVRKWRRRGGPRPFNARSPGCEPLNNGPEEKQNEDGPEDMKAELHSPVQPAGDKSLARASYTMKVYDPDDPSTYPPRLSELQGHLPMRIPVNPRGAPEIYEVC